MALNSQYGACIAERNVPQSAVGQGLLNTYALKDEAGVRDAEHILVAQRHRLHVGEGGGVPLCMDNGDWIPLPCLIKQSTSSLSASRHDSTRHTSDVCQGLKMIVPKLLWTATGRDWNYQCKEPHIFPVRDLHPLTVCQNSQSPRQ